ncbi:serine hydrolase domain-containing protein [Verrucomicrobium sp. BvORR034]|uniref:serine hydrolase domain-containing protein n=1 Tax=Verrucomicrobium sp. BvORR034 TaxID=1396418 RepID=UPI000678D788|nr:serine hydrolase domain-containing protein [Verrucomicrobium sp. BvORR034]
MRPHFLLLPLLALSVSWLPCHAEKPLTPIAASLRPFVADQTISGAVALVVNKDQVLSLETVGEADLSAKKPMTEDAMFWIASMTKPMTAMGVMMLVEEGKVEVDAPVAKYLPEFKGQMLVAEKSADKVVLKKPARPITVKDLFTHTSGLVGKSPLEDQALDALSLREAVFTYAISPLQFEPGSKWQYCNPGINTLGRIIEVVSGQPYAEFMQGRFFTPLGMKDTTFWPTDAQMERIAKSYQPKADKSPGLEETTVKYLTPPLSDRKRMALAAGGLFSTAGDLSRIYRMILNGGELDGKRYLKTETLKQMTTNQTGDMKVSFSDGMHMGLGFHIVNEPQGVTAALSPGSFGHGGAYGTQAWIDPTRGLGIVLLIQRANLPNSDKSDMRAALQKAAVEVYGTAKR